MFSVSSLDKEVDTLRVYDCKICANFKNFRSSVVLVTLRIVTKLTKWHAQSSTISL